MNEEINRGERAKQVLENELYKEAFAKLREQLIQGFEQTNFKQSDERDEIWRKLQSANFVQDYLEEVMETGKIARETLAQKAKKVVGL